MTRQYTSFRQFYPYYLSEHRHPICRLLHFSGSLLVLVILGLTLWSRNWLILIFLPVIGYGLAWAGHFFFEKNRPATFRYPLYSFLGDWVMFGEILTRKKKIFSP